MTTRRVSLPRELSLSSPQVLGPCASQVPGLWTTPPSSTVDGNFGPVFTNPFAVGPSGLPLCLGPIPGNGGAGGDFDIKDSVLPTCCAMRMDPELIHPTSPEVQDDIALRLYGPVRRLGCRVGAWERSLGPWLAPGGARTVQDDIALRCGGACEPTRMQSWKHEKGARLCGQSPDLSCTHVGVPPGRESRPPALGGRKLAGLPAGASPCAQELQPHAQRYVCLSCAFQTFALTGLCAETNSSYS
jgi:hypothetical protein